MKKHKVLRRTALFLSAVLLSEAVMPVSALQEDVEKQLKAVKSLTDLDPDANAAAIGILLQQCMELLPDGDPVKSTLQSIQVLSEGGSQNAAAVDLLLDGLLQGSGEAETEAAASRENGCGGKSGTVFRNGISGSERTAGDGFLTPVYRIFRCRN